MAMDMDMDLNRNGFERQSRTHIHHMNYDCMLALFDRLVYIKDLVACYQVCRRWRDIITDTVPKFKYLTVYDSSVNKKAKNNRRRDELLLDCDDLKNRLIDCKFSVNYRYRCGLSSANHKMFPNLRILYLDKSITDQVLNFLEPDLNRIQRKDEIKGFLEMHENQPLGQVSKWKMYGASRDLPLEGPRLRQLCMKRFPMADIIKINVSRFPELRVLYLEVESMKTFAVPHLGHTSLETFIIKDRSPGYQSFLMSMRFIDYCPRLSSMYIYMHKKRIAHAGVEEKPNRTIRNLVVVIDESVWPAALMKNYILYKFRGLRNLAIRRHPVISDYDVRELIANLSHLTILDLRGCPRITEVTRIFVYQFNTRNDRDITLYMDKDEVEDVPRDHWLQVGSDFMENYFYTNSPPMVTDDLHEYQF